MIIMNDNVKLHEEKDRYIHTETSPSTQNHDNNDCKIVCVSEAKLPPPPNVLQKLHFQRHVVNGGGNCLYVSCYRSPGRLCTAVENVGYEMHATIPCCTSRRWN